MDLQPSRQARANMRIEIRQGFMVLVLDLDLVLVLFRKFRYDSLIYIILGSLPYECPPRMYEFLHRRKIRTVFVHSVQLSAPLPQRLFKGMTRSTWGRGSARLAGED